jgi:hypothetical protein
MANFKIKGKAPLHVPRFYPPHLKPGPAGLISNGGLPTDERGAADQRIYAPVKIPIKIFVLM